VFAGNGTGALSVLTEREERERTAKEAEKEVRERVRKEAKGEVQGG